MRNVCTLEENIQTLAFGNAKIQNGILRKWLALIYYFNETKKFLIIKTKLLESQYWGPFK